jgi:hypothetical protein
MIWDCFLFFNELDVLEIRLNELKDRVHRFVLVEAATTFTNHPKPLHYLENKARFSEFNDRIEHVVVNDTSTWRDAWARERHQRNAISRGLAACSNDDLIMVSDVDEIPRASAIPTGGPVVFSQTLSYYCLNTATTTPWKGTRMWPCSLIRSGMSIQQIRESDAAIVPNGGWHFSYLGGVEMIQAKLTSFAHEEFGKAPYTNTEHLESCLRTGTDLYGREQRFARVPMNTLPRFVVDNADRFKHHLSPRSS